MPTTRTFWSGGCADEVRSKWKIENGEWKMENAAGRILWFHMHKKNGETGLVSPFLS